MDKPIPEAVVDALYDELFRVGRYLHAPVPIDPKGIIRRHLTAAQQQGQAVAEVVQESDGVSLRFVGAILPAGTKLYTAPQPTQQDGGEAAPPSAPVGVEGLQRWSMVRGSVYIDHDPEGEWVKWSDVQLAGLTTALAQQPAAVDEKYSELIYAVSRKYPGESRHETALRYIRQAESADHGPAQAATQHQEPTT